jgi:hypothetical protein
MAQGFRTAPAAPVARNLRAEQHHIRDDLGPDRNPSFLWSCFWR